MAQNLRVKNFNDGISPINYNRANWLDFSSPACASLNLNSSNDATYGLLYNFYAVETAALCPNGWHIANDEDFKKLEQCLGMPISALDSINVFRGAAQNIGGKIKSTSTQWTSPNVGATNESGFFGQPSGYRLNNGSFLPAGTIGIWWNNSAGSAEPTLVYRALVNNNTGISRNSFSASMTARNFGFSVRCVKD